MGCRGPAPAMRQLRCGASCCRAPGDGRAHAPLYLARHAVLAHDGTAVAQAARLSLHHEHPERAAGLGHEGAPRLPRRRFYAESRMGGIELPQPGEGLFQRSPHPSQRTGLLLGDLIAESVEGSAVMAKISEHGWCIPPQRPKHTWMA